MTRPVFCLAFCPSGGGDSGDFAVAEQAEEIAQAPAGKGHVMDGEKNWRLSLTRIGFVFGSAICSRM